MEKGVSMYKKKTKIIFLEKMSIGTFFFCSSSAQIQPNLLKQNQTKNVKQCKIMLQDTLASNKSIIRVLSTHIRFILVKLSGII